MSMNRFVGLGVFALSSSVLITLAACDDSATTAAATGGNTATGTGGSGNTSTGNGGTSTANGGTTTGNGGTTGTTEPGGCDSSTNLLTDADKSTTHNWIGGDGTLATDNPCGVQGAIYAYSDKGIDASHNTGDESVKTPGYTTDSADPVEQRESPCSGGKCCITGTTATWPVNGTTTDYSAEVWGGGIGITLNGNDAGVKSAFAGTAKGFNIALSGNLNGSKLRFKLTQSATDTAAPFKEVTTLPPTTALNFTGTDVLCPTAAAWGATNAYVLACLAPTAKPFDLQIEVVGGDVKADFNVCIDSITPML